MEKILSVIIPTYNMEALLPRCLDSLCRCASLSALDIIVVNDGSRDASLDVANRYAVRYPDSLNVIDKPNGNYGSTINAALPAAKGKYVKILDADDEFDTAELQKLVTELSAADEDIVVMPFTELHADGHRVVVRYDTMGREPYAYCQRYGLDDVLADGFIRFFLMHGLVYRTTMLKEMDYRQTEGVSYTDLEWATYPVYYAMSIRFSTACVYLYHLDREGQTMDPLVLGRQADQLLNVTLQLMRYHEAHRSMLSEGRLAWLTKYLENRVRIIYKLHLLDIPQESFSAPALSAAESQLLPYCAVFGLRPRLVPDNKILRLDYIAYWREHGARWPMWLQNLNAFLDSLAHAVYAWWRRK